MERKEYVHFINNNFDTKAKKILLSQLDNYYELQENGPINHKYKKGMAVSLLKGTLVHGIKKDLTELKSIKKNGLLAPCIKERKLGKELGIPCYELQQGYKLKNYVNFYSGATITFKCGKESRIKVVSNDKMNELGKYILNEPNVEHYNVSETLEASVLPSLLHNNINFALIYENVDKLRKHDLLTMTDSELKSLCGDKYESYKIDKKNSERKVNILYGIPAEAISGILVGKAYEKNKEVLKEIRELFPNAYICNLEGLIIID
jgi:hypothetical protein